ncbi:hypothetical protein GCM10017044_26390 [Kordiimonas sediminis]|uniref:DUF3572 family protein n=1 Tax=Kordiimonas sediminis TaxID=1735581 RepID=A0A919AZ81_9PROT|nr:DUF3572 domain-containing protein [Kordiimonas sediminis]GHF29825.1 hypothetical protein GCM10017044_26390 [Kordiimonas sediminis]
MTTEDAQAIALQAIIFIVSEDDLQERFVALSGLDGDAIKARLTDNDFLVGVLDFLINFEPDLIACAEHLDTSPETLTSAWRALGGGQGQEW